MKRTIILPMLTLGVLALAACANDKPAGDASGQTTTTSARAPDGLMSSNVNDTNATGAATNESPNPSMNTTTTTTTSNGSAANNVQNTPTNAGASNGSSDTQVAQTRAHSTSGHDATWGSGSTPAAGTNGNAAGASQPSTTAPPPPQTQNGGSAVTPIDQGNNKADLKITQQIRKAVVSDSSLSWTAKNVKIITQNGRVTLRGEVKSDDEKKWLEATADKVVGNANVDNQLQVKP